MDNSVYLYSVPDCYQLRCKFNSTILDYHFDISKDGMYMHTNCSAYESLLSQIPHARQVSSPEEKDDKSRCHDQGHGLVFCLFEAYGQHVAMIQM